MNRDIYLWFFMYDENGDKIQSFDCINWFTVYMDSVENVSYGKYRGLEVMVICDDIVLGTLELSEHYFNMLQTPLEE